MDLQTPTNYATQPTFGTCTVAADGNVNNNAFVLRVTATVLNISGNVLNTTLANTATMSFNDPAITGRVLPDANAGNDPLVTVVEPQLSLSKSASGGSYDAGDPITYTFTINNSGSQAAYNVTLSDPIPSIVTSPTILTTPGDFTATGFSGSSVVAASTASLSGFSGGSFSGAPTSLDGVTFATGDRVLVKDQAASAQNGIYVVVSSGNWSRATDFDQASEITVGYRVSVAGGTTQAGYVYSQTATVTTVNTDPITWALYTSSYNSSVVAASTVNLGGFSGGSFSGAATTLDGVTLANNDRVLVKNQTTPAQNGIYAVTSSGNWSRATDFDQTSEITLGYRVRVVGGTTNAGYYFVQTATVTTVNTDPITWLFSPAFNAGFAAPTVNDFEINAGTLRIKPASSVDVPPGASVTLKVTGTVGSSFQPGQTIPNTAAIQWTSTAGRNGDERTGTGIAPNTYATSSSVTSTAKTMVVSKSVFSTDEAGTSGNNVAIGELVTYRVTVSLPEGTIPSLAVVDTIPSGMAYVPGSVAVSAFHPISSTLNVAHPGTSDGTVAFNATGLAVPTVTPASPVEGTQMTFTFAQIVVADDNDINNNTFSFTYQVVVLDVVGNAGLLGGQVTRANAITYSAGSANGSGVIDPAGNTVTVVEPHLNLSQSVVVNGSGTTGDAGDLAVYTMGISHNANSTETAFDVTFSEPMPAQIGDSVATPLTMASVTVTSPTLGDLSSLFEIVGGTLQTKSGVSFDLGLAEAVSITINGVLRNTVQPGQAYTSTATIGYTTRNGDFAAGAFNPNPNITTDHERVYSANSPVTVTVTESLSLLKTLTATSHTIPGATAGNDLAIGEKATYQLTVTVQEGTTADVTVTDTVPSGLQYVSGTAYFRSAVRVTATGKNSSVAYTDGTAIDSRDITDGTTGASGGGSLVFSLINVVAPGATGIGTKAFSIENQLLAMNIAANTSGQTRQNSAVAASTALGLATSASAQTATIKEPALGMTKTLITAGADAGDPVVYEVAIQNAGASTAYDLVVTDTLDSNLELVAPYGSKLVVQGTPPAYVVLDTSGNTASGVNATLSELRVGDAVTVRITARVKATAPAKQTIANNAHLTYTSLPGVDANERTGTGVGPNSYHTTASSASFTLTQPTVDKSFKNGSATEDVTSVASSTAANVVIGEQVTFDILVTLPEGVTKALQVLDNLPTGLRFESYEIVTTAGSAAHQSTLLSQSFNGTTPALSSPPSAQNGPATLTFNFGDTTTAADNIGANNAFVIRIVATVQNIMANQETITRANTATLSFTDPNNSQTITQTDSNPGNDPVVTIVEPTLTVTKTVDKPSADAGDTLVYTITLANSSTQLGYDTALNDVLPGELSLPQILTGADFTTKGYNTPSTAATTGVLGGAWDAGNGGQFTGVTVPLLVDGVTLAVNDRVLVKDEVIAAHNGIYVVTVVDTTATLVRAGDFDVAGQMVAGYLAMVSSGGAANGGQVFRLVASVGTVNTDPIIWTYYATYTVPTPATFAITSGTLGVASGAELYLPPNGSVVLKVSGVLAQSVTPNETLANHAYVYWGSADSTVTARRDGSDVVPPTLTTPDGSKLNNYGVASGANTTVPVMSASKSLFSTDRTETSGASVTIGEKVTYALKVTLPEGTAPDLTVTDLLPAGMQYDSYQLITARAASQNDTGTYLLQGDFVGTVPTPSVSGGTGNGVAVAFTFGSISTTGNNLSTDNSFLVLVTARVLDVVGNVGFSPPGQTTLENSATFDISTDGQSAIASGPVTVTVVEPRMVIGKNIVQATADVGDQVTVILTAQNIGTSAAYDVVVQDILDAAQFNPSTVGLGVSGTDYPSDFTPNNAAGTLTYSGGTIPASATRTFTFVVNLSRTLLSGGLANNTAHVTQATTLQGAVPNERNEPDVNASDSLTLYTHALSGYVYADANNDGIKQGGETPLSGVTVALTGTDHLGNSVNLSTTTLLDGSYSFAGLRPGNYIVTRATTPPGYLDGKETVGATSGPSAPAYGGIVNVAADSVTINAIAIPMGNNSVGTGYNFGLIVPNSLAGTVYNDLNNNGVWNSGTDRGIANVIVTLTGTDDRGNSVNTPAASATDGSYSFPSLRPGTYTITETQPDGYTDSTDTVGSAGGTLGNDVISAITLAQNQNGTGYNFGEIGAGSIGDTVFLDLNNNGVADAGEGISGVTVRLQGDLNGDGILDGLTALTDANGHYLFDHLPAPTGGQDYTVTVLSGVAAGLTQTVDPDGIKDGASVVHLTAAAPVNLNQDFGYRGAGQIGDTVFADNNGNGSPDAGEGIPNITVTLHGDVDGDGVQETVTASTDANGNYLFTGLWTTVAGVAYTVTVDQTSPDFPAGLTVNTVDPDGGGDSTSRLSLTDASPINLNQDFGYRGTGQIGDTVFADLNGNGSPDAGEGIPNITVTLRGDVDGDGVPEAMTTSTDANGKYLFTGLRTTVAGVAYTVTVDTADPQFPPGMTINSVDPDGGGDSTSVVNLSQGSPVNLNQDFGYLPTYSIGNRVFLDDGTGSGTAWDGILNGGESGIGSVEVWLISNEVHVATMATDPEGYYRFDNLLPGTAYRVFLPAADFATGQPLAGMYASLPVMAGDNGNKGVADANPELYGISTGVFTVGVGLQPTGETDLGLSGSNPPQGHGPSGDAYDDLTQDFALNAGLPTLAMISEMRAWAGVGSATVEWRTVAEVGSVSFELDRQTTNGAWLKVNAEPVVAMNCVTGAVYQVVDMGVRAGDAVAYRVREREENGTERVLGVAELTVAAGPEPVVSAEPDASAEPTAKAAKGTSGAWVPASQPWVLDSQHLLKLTTTQGGAQYLSAQNLALALGWPLAQAQALLTGGEFGLWNFGQAVAMLPAQDGSGLYFYAERLKNNFADQNVYWLGTSVGPDMATVEGGQPEAQPGTYYLATQDNERDVSPVLTVATNGDQDFWMWQRMVAGTRGFDTGSSVFVADHVAAVAGAKAQVVVRLQGGTAGANLASISLNGVSLGQPSWQGMTPLEAVLEVPAGVVTNGNNTLKIVALMPAGAVSSQFYLNSYMIKYPRFYVANNGQLEFGADGNQVATVSGFTQPQIVVWEVSDPQVPRVVTPVRVEAGSGGYQVSLATAGGQGKYLAFQMDAVPAVAGGQTVALAGLADPARKGAYVVITPAALADGAASLALYRQMQHLTVQVVKLEDIANEFGYGLKTPHAIQAFLTSAWNHWSVPPQYAVLVGRGTYDYRNLTGLGGNLLPPLLVGTDYGLAASDPALGDVNGDGVPEIAVGRLSVTSVTQLKAMVDKIKAYELQGAPVGLKGLLVSDAPDAAGDFGGDLGRIGALLAGYSQNQVVNGGAGLSLDQMRGAIQAGLNGGVDLVNYVGHGGFDRLGLDGYLTAADASVLTNRVRVPIVVAMTCVVGQYSVPGGQCFGEAMTLQAGSGAVAVWSPTGLSLNGDASALNQWFVRQLGQEGAPRLGDVIRAAVRGYSGESRRMGAWTYNLLGDPGLRIKTARTP